MSISTVSGMSMPLIGLSRAAKSSSGEGSGTWRLSLCLQKRYIRELVKSVEHEELLKMSSGRVHMGSLSIRRIKYFKLRCLGNSRIDISIACERSSRYMGVTHCHVCWTSWSGKNNHAWQA